MNGQRKLILLLQTMPFTDTRDWLLARAEVGLYHDSSHFQDGLDLLVRDLKRSKEFILANMASSGEFHDYKERENNEH